MMKLEAGMYIRTNEGIRKIIEEYDEGYELDIDLHFKYPEGHDLYKKDIDEEIDEIILSEPSYNIVDLIKPKDIILGKDGKIYQCQKIYKDYVFTYSKNRQGLTITLVDYQIDKILTHEQIEREAYKV